MQIITHSVNNTRIAEVVATEIIISSSEDGLDLMGSLYYQGFDSIIIHEPNITPAFFDLKNGIAGEILQKFSTYRVRLAIVGAFEKYAGRSLRDFIFESNKGRQVNFLSTTEEAIKALSSS